MSRAARLLELAQALRRRRAPVAGAELAQELGVSLRSLYRDIDTLRTQGAPIEGEAGLGYVLRPGFTLPPLMFAPAEIDALTLGLRWAARQGDPGLSAAARDALAKISAVLPPRLGEAIESSPLLPFPRRAPRMAAPLPALRQALSAHVKVALDYVDGAGEATRRVVWPVSIGFFEGTLMLAAWCELRESFRHFRLDRMRAAQPLAARVPKPRRGRRRGRTRGRSDAGRGRPSARRVVRARRRHRTAADTDGFRLHLSRARSRRPPPAGVRALRLKASGAGAGGMTAARRWRLPSAWRPAL